MKKSLLLIALLGLLSIIFSGCAAVEEDPDSELPWTESESWEYQIPGMGGLNSSP